MTTRLDIARHWIAAHPPRGGYRPSHMGPALFREVFGPVCAAAAGGSPEAGAAIAEQIHAAGLGPEADAVPELFRRLEEARGVPADPRSILDRLEALIG